MTEFVKLTFAILPFRLKQKSTYQDIILTIAKDVRFVNSKKQTKIDLLKDERFNSGKSHGIFRKIIGA
jgi:hypothetical protein